MCLFVYVCACVLVNVCVCARAYARVYVCMSECVIHLAECYIKSGWLKKYRRVNAL